MANTILTFIFLLSFSKISHSEELTIPPLNSLLSRIENTSFSFKEHALLFGFNSLHSCLYVGKTAVILKHYCYPKKSYPARAYKIISAEYGVIDFYEENLPSGLKKRDITLSTFPNHLREILNFNLEKSNFALVNKLVEVLYLKNLPSCWSTNRSFSQNTPEVRCRIEDVKNFELWSEETQNTLNDDFLWNSLMKKIDHSLRD